MIDILIDIDNIFYNVIACESVLIIVAHWMNYKTGQNSLREMQVAMEKHSVLYIFVIKYTQ